MDEKRRGMVDRGRRRSTELAEGFRLSMREYRASITHAKQQLGWSPKVNLKTAIKLVVVGPEGLVLNWSWMK